MRRSLTAAAGPAEAARASAEGRRVEAMVAADADADADEGETDATATMVLESALLAAAAEAAVLAGKAALLSIIAGSIGIAQGPSRCPQVSQASASCENASELFSKKQIDRS